MALETVISSVDDLLAHHHLRRKLPPAAERQRIRQAAGISLRELAAALGVSHMAVVRWEAGARPADPAHVASYGRLLNELRRLEGVPAD
jgi:DNA-binding transcriptional regulator YiaG